MLPYRSNSPQYLDYLASIKTREQIEADPRLCVFLNNEYIKDNMEVALRYAKSKTGDYADKMAFVEYYMCNGPELDTDTLNHYRTKILLDPVATEIAYTYYSNMEYVSEIRLKKYEKPDDLWGCFGRPCFYIGRFSAALGKIASIENSKSVWNVLADSWTPSAKEMKDAIAADRKSSNPEASPGLLNVIGGMASSVFNMALDTVGISVKPENPVKPSGGRDMEGEGSSVPIEEHLRGWIPRPILNGWSAMTSMFDMKMNDFMKKMQAAGNMDASSDGDNLAISFQKHFELLTHANIKRQMGDCARLWDQARRLQIFNPNQNTNGPIQNGQMEGQTCSGVSINGGNSVKPSQTGANL